MKVQIKKGDPIEVGIPVGLPVPIPAILPRVQVDKLAELPPPADGAVAAPIDPELLQHLSPILRAELRILTAVSLPTPAQRREIAMEGGRTVKELARDLAAMNNGLAVAQPAARIRSSQSDPRKRIHETIETAAKAKLTPEQFARFEAESARKTQDRREVVLLNTVVKLDQLLVLTLQQRDKLEEALRSNWDDRVYPQVEILQTYEAYFPNIPEAQINPILTAEQRKIWKDTQKINFNGLRMNVGFNNFRVEMIPAQDEDADVKAALAEDVKSERPVRLVLPTT